MELLEKHSLQQVVREAVGHFNSRQHTTGKSKVFLVLRKNETRASLVNSVNWANVKRPSVCFVYKMRCKNLFFPAFQQMLVK